MTEKTIKPERVFEIYSIEPLKYVLEDLEKQNNYFLVGRTGVGKSMILILFNPLYQKALFETENIDPSQRENRTQLIEMIPKKVIGIYWNLDNPLSRVTRFQGELLKEEEWRKSFGDFIGHRLLENFITAIEVMKDNQKWREIHKIRDFDEKDLDSIAKDFSINYCEELPECNPISSWLELKKIISFRIARWKQATNELNNDIFNGPTHTIDLLMPCLLMMQELKNHTVIEEDCRLFIIIDQYEVLFKHKEIIDFRPVFNLAMRNAARDKNGIEFKIGVRTYAYKDNFKVDNSTVELEIERELKIIDIDERTEEYYHSFIKDLTQRCLIKFPEYTGLKPNDLFESLNPLEEVKKYIIKTKDKEKQFTRFFSSIVSMKEDIQRLIIAHTSGLKDDSLRVWIQTILAIKIEQILQKKKINLTEIERYLAEEFPIFLKIISEECKVKCTESTIHKTKSKNYSSEKDWYEQHREGALFLIASAYKNIPKINCGFGTIEDTSSRIVSNFLEIVSEIFNLANQKEDNTICLPIPARIQSNAILKKSTEVFESIPNIIPHGIKVRKFLLKLGLYYRAEQITPNQFIPFPNEFTLQEKLQYQPAGITSEENSLVIADLLSYGLLEESIHSERTPSKGVNRYKYSLNKILCPYFSITVHHRRHPIYPLYEKLFLDLLLDDENHGVQEFRGQLVDKDQQKIDKWLGG